MARSLPLGALHWHGRIAGRLGSSVRLSVRAARCRRCPEIHPDTFSFVRHEGEAPKERSTCGWRHLLISRRDQGLGVAAWVHVVDIDGAREHYHRRGTELYYVLEGEGTIRLDGVEHPIRKGSVVHIPPGVIHGAQGRMRVLVIGIPDIADDDLFFPEDAGPP